MPDMIFHIALHEDWHAAQRAGEYTTSTLGRTLDEEGFIHASHRHQVTEVIRRHYRGIGSPLYLLVIDPDRVEAEIREEPVPGTDETYPHIYGPLNVDAVSEAIDLSAGQAPT